MSPTRNYTDLTPILQKFWLALRPWYSNQYPGRSLFITCAYRSVEEQQAIFAKNRPGRIITKCDGVTSLSKHNTLPSRAFDVAVTLKGVVRWEDEYYKPLGGAIKALGYEGKIRWGGWFSSFKDYPHLEEI